MTTVCVIMGVLASFSVPRFGRAMEQSRANIAVAKLQTIWTAQRLYWLQYSTFAPDLQTLRNLNYIDQAIIDDNGGMMASTPGVSYVFSITPGASPTAFSATARRVNSTIYVSTLSIDNSGYISGNVQYVGSSTAASDLAPIDQFFQ